MSYFVWIAVVALLVWVIKLLSKLECNVQLALKEKYGVSLNTLNDKVIWVTGASSGIGRQIVLHLAQVKCKIVVSARNEQQLNELKQICLENNSQLKDDDILVLKFDVTKLESHDPALNRVLHHFGQIDVLVNNAGVGQGGSFEKIELELDRKVFETNVFGPVALARVLCKHWIQSNRPGHLVLNSSVSSILNNPWSSAYCASKTAITAYMKCLEKEYMHFKNPICCTIVHPGPVETNIFAQAYRCKVSDTYGSDFVPKSGMVGMSNWVSAERCGQLFVVAIANKVRSAYICHQPLLSFTWCAYYLPGTTEFIWKIILKYNREALEKVYLD